jgi:hypothetical protein
MFQTPAVQAQRFSSWDLLLQLRMGWDVAFGLGLLLGVVGVLALGDRSVAILVAENALLR